MSSSKLDDRTWFATYKHEVCCDTCPNDDAVFIQMIKDARREGAESMREAAAKLVEDLLSHTLTDAHKKIRALPLP